MYFQPGPPARFEAFTAHGRRADARVRVDAPLRANEIAALKFTVHFADAAPLSLSRSDAHELVVALLRALAGSPKGP